MGFSFKSKSGSSTGGGVGDEELDRNVEEEIARNLWAHHRMLPPESKGKKLWNKFIVVLVLYTCISVPLVLCFNLDYGAPNNIPQVVVRPVREGLPLPVQRHRGEVCLSIRRANSLPLASQAASQPANLPTSLPANQTTYR